MLTEKIDQKKDIERQEKLLIILKDRLEILNRFLKDDSALEELIGKSNKSSTEILLLHNSYREEAWGLEIDIETKENILSEHKQRMEKEAKNLISDIAHEMGSNFKDLIKESKILIKEYNIPGSTANEIISICDKFYQGRFESIEEKIKSYSRLREIVFDIKDALKK